MFTSMNEIWELNVGEEDFYQNNLQYIFSIILIKFFFFCSVEKKNMKDWGLLSRYFR